MSDYTYLYKVFTTAFSYIAGEMHTTSGYDYLSLTHTHTKKEINKLKLFTTKDTNRRPAVNLTVLAIIP